MLKKKKEGGFFFLRRKKLSCVRIYNDQRDHCASPHAEVDFILGKNSFLKGQSCPGDRT